MSSSKTNVDYLLRIAQSMKGKSVFAVLPREYVKSLGISKGDKLKMQLADDQIIISKAVLA